MSTDNDKLNPRTTHYEFFGPIGALAVTVLTPGIVYALYFGCSEETGGCPPSGTAFPHLLDLWDTQEFLIYLGYYIFCVACWYLLPCQHFVGLPMRNGATKRYKLNGFSTFLVAIGATLGTIFVYGPGVLSVVYNKWVGFVTAAVVWSFLQSLYVYVMSFRQGKLLALGGNTGNVIYDFFIGRELHPSIGSFDIKSFSELRPGLVLFVLLNISMLCEQATRRGGFSGVTDSMWLVAGFEVFYAADALYHESALFTTMDITTEGFGFMLCFGSLAWVPFTYSLQARYLVFHQIELGPVTTTAIFLFHGIGYYIFRTANREKNNFRNGKNPKNLQYITTERGSKILISGWWGASRHPNYFGDLIMALAWSLPTGFSTPITYFYVAFFTVLLLHRQHRDDQDCRRKHGLDWVKYKKLVPYRIIPYIY